MAFNGVTDGKAKNSSSKQLVEHHPDKWSSYNNVEVTKEDIVKNYYLLNEKWLAVIEHNMMLNQNITSLKLEKSDIENRSLELSNENEVLNSAVIDLKKQVKGKQKAYLELNQLKKRRT